MFQFLAMTQPGCRQSFPRHLLLRVIKLALSAVAVLVAQVAYMQPVNADQASRPNIILIMADDLGWKELGCYGQQKIRTPHIDELAAKGMRFLDYYSGAPVCAPSRCVLMTGKHMGHAQVKGNFEVQVNDRVNFRGQWPLATGTTTMASVLKSAGYATGAFGKWGLGGVGSTGDPLKQGFDRFFGYNCQRHAHNLFPRYLVDDDQRLELPGNDRGLTGEQYAPHLIADQLLEFVREQGQHAREGERLLGSSEVLESVIGKFKYLAGERGQHGMTGMALSIGAFVGRQAISTVQTALEEITTHDAWKWCREHLGATVQSVRRKIHRAIGIGTKTPNVNR